MQRKHPIDPLPLDSKIEHFLEYVHDVFNVLLFSLENNLILCVDLTLLLTYTLLKEKCCYRSVV